MTTIVLRGGDREGPLEVDAQALVAAHDRGDAYFWLERDVHVTLEVHHVRWGAEGFTCCRNDWQRGERAYALRRGGEHGLALTYDGGGCTELIDRVCVLDAADAVAVIQHFIDAGGCSDVVAWGEAVVLTEAGHAPGWNLEEIGAPSGPREQLPGGYRARFEGAPDPSLAQTATWRVVAEVEMHDERWLATLADHPMPGLRRLSVRVDEAPTRLPAAIAGMPRLEALTVYGAGVVELPPLTSSSLARLTIGLGVEEDDVEPVPGWVSRVAAVLGRSELPGLCSASIVSHVELELGDGDE